MTEQVLFSVKSNGVAEVLLNRPKALNSLTLPMVTAIQTQLKAWEDHDDITVILLRGAGEKGFCAGGDIKVLYQAQYDSDALQQAKKFFRDEYQLDQYIYSYPKPIIAILDGIVMGGGVGLSYGARYKICTERTKWAMPEMNIGFFPDVGSSHFMLQAPGELGTYVALTASTLTAPDILYMNAANYYVESESLHCFLEEITSIQPFTDEQIPNLLKKYAIDPYDTSKLKDLQFQIDQHFVHRSVEEIIASLEQDENEFAQATLKTLRSKPATSLKVTRELYNRSMNKPLKEIFEMEYVVASHFMKNADFFEGVRAVLVDKDHHPNYVYPNLFDLSHADVEAFFHKPL